MFDYGQFEGSEGYWLEVSNGDDIISYKTFDSLNALHKELNREKRLRKVLGIVSGIMNKEAADGALQKEDIRILDR